MHKIRSGSFLTACMLVVAAIVPSHAAARTPPSPYSYCAADGARVDGFDHGAGPEWTVFQRPMKTPSAPYPDGSIDGDTRANVQTGGGMLHLMSRRAGNGFTGSRIFSREPMRYGCVEFVARLPRGRGFWPALWMRTPYDGSPMNGEIDVAEGFGSHPGVFMSTLHHWRNGIDADSTHRRVVDGVDRTHTCAKVVADTAMPAVETGLAMAGAKLAGIDRGQTGNWLFANYQNACALSVVNKGTDFSASFHRYLIVWTPDRVLWVLDGRRYFETTDDVPHVAMMIVMGLSVGALDGGTNGSTPETGDLQVKSVRIMDLRRP